MVIPENHKCRLCGAWLRSPAEREIGTCSCCLTESHYMQEQKAEERFGAEAAIRRDTERIRREDQTYRIYGRRP